MKSSSTMVMRLGMLALCAMITSGVIAQQVAPAASGVPADPTAPTTAMSQPAGTMTKGELKAQRKQQKLDEAAAKANTKAAKAQAALVGADSKSKEANDKALQAQEKAGQVTQTPVVAPDPGTTAPPPPSAPQTTAPPQ
jgi:hypothetical protein